MKSHIAIYGTLKVRRMFCRGCKCWTIVAKDGNKVCCDKPYRGEPKEFKRMVEAEKARRRPRANVRKMLLEKFDNACCYCGRHFGTFVNYKNKDRQVRVNWDHEIPFSYSFNNSGENFLPSCSFCNNWKSNKMFNSMEEVQVYVNSKWEEAETTTS